MHATGAAPFSTAQLLRHRREISTRALRRCISKRVRHRRPTWRRRDVDQVGHSTVTLSAWTQLQKHSTAVVRKARLGQERVLRRDLA
eukprot:1074304-Pleurochrysis_carterae.AAC.6